MSIAEAVIQKLNTLPLEKQEEVLEFVDSLAKKAADAKPYSFLDVALSQNLKGPKDWAANFEEYLHGDKRDEL
jgi:hypothetical protein